LGPMFAAVGTGSFFVESIFRVPGMGRFFVLSMTGRDYPMIMAVVLTDGAFLAVMNLVVDLLYGVLDPRIRYYTRRRASAPSRYLLPRWVARAQPALGRGEIGDGAVVEPVARRLPAPAAEPPRDGRRRGDRPALPRRDLRRPPGAAPVHEDQLRSPPHAPHSPQRAHPDRRLGHVRDPRGDLHRGGAVVHRRRHQPADPIVGPDGRRGAAVHPLRLAPVCFPVDRHRGYHAVVHV